EPSTRVGVCRCRNIGAGLAAADFNFDVILIVDSTGQGYLKRTIVGGRRRLGLLGGEVRYGDAGDAWDGTRLTSNDHVVARRGDAQLLAVDDGGVAGVGAVCPATDDGQRLG